MAPKILPKYRRVICILLHSPTSIAGTLGLRGLARWQFWLLHTFQNYLEHGNIHIRVGVLIKKQKQKTSISYRPCFVCLFVCFIKDLVKTFAVVLRQLSLCNTGCLKFTILPLPLKCWNSRCVPPHLAIANICESLPSARHCAKCSAGTVLMDSPITPWSTRYGLITRDRLIRMRNLGRERGPKCWTKF